jgi:hypothetical protein
MRCDEIRRARSERCCASIASRIGAESYRPLSMHYLTPYQRQINTLTKQAAERNNPIEICAAITLPEQRVETLYQACPIGTLIERPAVVSGAC